MYLLKTIQKSIEKSVLEYTHLLTEKYGIPEDELVEMWEEVTKMRIKTTANQSKRMSPWLRFCKEERSRIRATHPNMPFGEISKRIGEKWSSMTSEERASYLATIPNSNPTASESTTKESTTTTTTTSVVTTPPPTGKGKGKGKKTTTTTTTKKKVDTSSSSSSANSREEDAIVDPSLWTKENLEKMKIEELRELCSNVQLSKSGKKSDLVDRLLKSIQYSSNAESGGSGGGWTKIPGSTENETPHRPDEDEDDERSHATKSVSSEFDYDYPSDG